LRPVLLLLLSSLSESDRIWAINTHGLRGRVIEIGVTEEREKGEGGEWKNSEEREGEIQGDFLRYFRGDRRPWLTHSVCVASYGLA